MSRGGRTSEEDIDNSELVWRKSSASGDSGQECVEVATVSAAVIVRNSRDREGPTLAFAHQEWARLIAVVQEHGGS